MIRTKASGRWPIGRHTPSRMRLSKGDRVLFYLAGEEGRKFLGSAKLRSGLQTAKEAYEAYVVLENIQIWDKPLEIKELIDQLKFIKNKKNWGLHLQGGVIRIPEIDFELISRKGSTT